MKPDIWRGSSSQSPRNPSTLGILSRKTQESFQLLVFPLNPETTPNPGALPDEGHRDPRHPWVLAHPLPRRSTHHASVSWRNEATVHGDKAAAVECLWEEKGLRHAGSWVGRAHQQASGSPPSWPFLNPRQTHCPGEQSLEFNSWPGPNYLGPRYPTR